MVYPTHPNLQVTPTPRAAVQASRIPSRALTAWATAVARWWARLWAWADVDAEECE